jgi:hypothetical protein
LSLAAKGGSLLSTARKEGRTQEAGVDSAETYSQVDFASFNNFFGKNLEEFQDTISGFASKSSANSLEDVFPFRHLNGQAG